MGRAASAMARLHTRARQWRSSPMIWLIAGGFVLMTATAIGSALTIERFKQNAIESGRENLENAVRLLAEHFDRQLEDFAVLQKSVISQLESSGIDSPEIFRSEMATLEVHEMLREKASSWPDIAGVNVFDGDGTLINSSKRWPVADVSISDRAYFRHLKQDRSLGGEIEVVPRRLGDGGPTIVFARPISGPHGSFLGVVTRTITPKSLETFFRSAGLGDNSSIAMHNRNGQLLARVPHVEGAVGQNFRRDSSPKLMEVFDRPALTTILASPFDGKERLVASHQLTSEPLVVVATRTLDATLATWRVQTKFFLAVAVLSTVLLVLTLYLIFRQMTGRLSVEKERLDTAMDTMTQGLLMFDSDGRLIVCNRSYIEMYGLSTDVAKPGISLQDLIRHRRATGSFVGDLDSYCDEVLRSVGNFHGTLIEIPDGRLIEVKNYPGASGGWLATHEDVTERMRAQERIAHMAHYNSLTDLPNRVLMREHLERRTAELTKGNSFAILYIDIDGFKDVNDTLGHGLGDELLRQIADRLRSCVDPQDLVARLGGDEFAIVKSETGDQAELAVLAKQVLATVRLPVECNGQEIAVDASVGIAVAPEHGNNLDDLLKHADMAMYAAKSSGRGAFRFFAAELDIKLKQRRQLELDLRHALANGEFELHYQPLVDLAADTISGCEALLRWRHPVRGMVSPVEFIPLTEETGLIEGIGEWVLEQACSEAASWPGHIKVAVNVSPVQFRSNTLALKVAAALGKSGLAPARLELEITETVLIRDDDGALAILRQLRELGVRIALDDFGTGYSSLSYLHRFPFDKIKIDRSFVSDIGEPDDSSPIVQAVVQMAGARDMTTTAEGVETEAQRRILRQLGCSQMQGYLFSPAVPASKLKSLLLNPHSSAA